MGRRSPARAKERAPRRRGQAAARAAGAASVPAGAPTPSKKLDTMVKGVKGKGPVFITPFRGSPDRSDTKTPYYSVSPTALRQAEDALAKEDVPAAYRKPVKQYFEGIKGQ